MTNKDFNKLLSKNYFKIKPHKQVQMCSKCYGLIKDRFSNISRFKKDKEIKWCNCGNKYGVLIDRNLFKAIQMFNIKGYKTYICCEGHDEDNSLKLESYIQFNDNYMNYMYQYKDFLDIDNIKNVSNKDNTIIHVETTIDEFKNNYPCLDYRKLLKEQFINNVINMAKDIKKIGE